MILAASLLFDPLLADVRWLPGFGARWLWGISAAHLLASWLCFRNATVEYQPLTEGHHGRIPWFWRGLAAFMFALFLNKFFDLQTLITIFLRQQSRNEGWYPSRQSVQWIFVQAVLTVGVIVLVGSLLSAAKPLETTRARQRERNFLTHAHSLPNPLSQSNRSFSLSHALSRQSRQRGPGTGSVTIGLARCVSPPSIHDIHPRRQTFQHN